MIRTSVKVENQDNAQVSDNGIPDFITFLDAGRTIFLKKERIGADTIQLQVYLKKGEQFVPASEKVVIGIKDQLINVIKTTHHEKS